MALNEKYSVKDFLCQDLSDRDPREFDGTIRGTCFHQHQPGTEVFPKGITTTFVGCNLCNTVIPATATVGEGCQTTQLRAFSATVKATGEKLKDRTGREVPAQDWEVNESGDPVAPFIPKAFDKESWPKDPNLLTLTAESAAAIGVD